MTTTSVNERSRSASYDDLMATAIAELEEAEQGCPEPDPRIMAKTGAGAFAWYIAYTTHN